MVSSLLSNDTSLTDTTQRQKMGFVERLRTLGYRTYCRGLDRMLKLFLKLKLSTDDKLRQHHPEQ